MTTGVVLLSGGIDSATCLAIACNRHDEVIPVHIQYGQQTGELEHHLAETLRTKMNNGFTTKVYPLQVIDYSTVFAHFSEGVADPDKSFEELVEEDGRSSGYVPMRNLHLLSTAAAVADVRDGDMIYIGVQGGDEDSYPDCRPAFITAATTAINRSLADGDAISVKTPLIDLKKHEVIELGERLSVPWEYTYSCYEEEDTLADPNPCGQCPACVERIEAFKEAGVNDPHYD